MELSCVLQKYAWGKIGSQSAAASLKKGSDADFDIDPSSPYAELWMGTHPNGPSTLKASGELLSSHIAQFPETLGEKSRKLFGDNLPFLFKVLSVNQALSIQAHPNKEHAEKLFAERPDVYKDPNHKPEMAIALTKFEGLCGFRRLKQIKAFVEEVPELATVIGEENAQALLKASDDDYQDALKAAFSSLMKADKELLKQKLESLHSTLEKKSDKNEIDLLFLRLIQQYPGDVGCFVIYFVNYLKLEPGESMFLGPNLIHAYLSGDCIECMACSDNVVRAGLTPKLIDVPTLCGMLKYQCQDAEKLKFKPVQETDVTTVYNPSVPDFAVAKICLSSPSTPIPVRESASIVIVISGEGKLVTTNDGSEIPLVKGTVFFAPASQKLEVEKLGPGDLVMYQAFC
jgi:mannose-6-phosphate isomerase